MPTPALLQATHLPHAQLQQLGRLGLRVSPLFHVLQRSQTIPFALAHRNPVSFLRHSNVLPAQWQKRTFLLA
jgi:hypothetical protein